MARGDLALLKDLARDGLLFQGYHPRVEALHQRHATRLAALIDAHGWPGRSRVGEEGAQAAWLILQHAIRNPPLMRRGDRKSTRLNSSHGYISYAVFCLKKKNNT